MECKTDKTKKMKFSDEQLEVAKQMGNNPEDVYDMPMEEVPVEPVVEPMPEEPKERDLKAELKAIADNKETSDADKKTANELIARLEELAQAEKNAEKFIGEKKPEEPKAEEKPVEPVAPEAPAMPEVPAEAPKA